MNTTAQKPAATAEIPFPEELVHLDEIELMLKNALEESEREAQRHGDEYKESIRYMAEYRNEIDPKEIFQAERMLRDIEHSGLLAVRERERYTKLVESPYFSRIDFCAESDTEDKAYYIGRFSFSQNRKILIFDWRAPISSMFYDYELGKAGFEAPVGRIEGSLNRKRQFKITSGRMEYALESSMQIQDDVLQRELSSTSDDKMKTIISTLQREQNMIIRNEKAGTIVLQGVAGSGKTSIALHRVAFLLYRFKKDLIAKNVVILSPNKVFGDYIAGVLPELGEDPIYQMSLWDIADVQLTGIMDCLPDPDPLEALDPAWCEREKFKSTLEFADMLDEFLKDAVDELFVPEDYSYGRFSVSAQWILERYRAYKRFPLMKRVDEIVGDIYEKFLDLNLREEAPPKRRSILKHVRAMLKAKNALDLYKAFYKRIDKQEMLYMPNKHTLEWADVYPFMYLYAMFNGLQTNLLIKHVVIDEMQDYTPIQYKLINLLFQCNKTILGDFGQSVNPNHLNTLEDMCSIYGKESLVELNKSYRSSYEIINFARRISKISKLEPVERHGEEPALIQCESEEAMLKRIKQEIDKFKAGRNNTLGIVLKTRDAAKALYQALGDIPNMHLLTPESRKFEGGISVSCVQMSKGLEFDEVIIPHADSSNYNNACDRNLLYIACTRAMHKLSLIHTGGLSRLIDVWPQNN